MPLAQESNRKSLEAAVETAAEFLNSKGKCAIVAGVKVRSCHAEDALLKFADATDYPVTGELASPTTGQDELRASAQHQRSFMCARHSSHDLCTHVDPPRSTKVWSTEVDTVTLRKALRISPHLRAASFG